MSKPSVLVLDDKPNMLQLLQTILEPEYDVSTSADPRRAIELVAQTNPDVVVTDIRMPDMDGMEVLQQVRRVSPDTEVILMTAYGTVKQAVQAVKLGAYDYVTKPFEMDEMLLVIAKAVERKRLVGRAAWLERQVEQRFAFDSIVGESPAMKRVFALMRTVLDTDSTVLVVGESGTGKELVARALHFNGKRRKGKFVVVHCAGIPRELAESEIFGHAKGAFSGATSAKRGLSEEADGGTLFLDDVDQLGLDIQAKLNRLIQEKEIRAVGENEWRKVDVRIVAATNRDLKDLVARGQFREDLYYRLNVFQIALPPLRNRQEDLPMLSSHLLQKHATQMRVPVPRLSPAATAALLAYRWPGNIRELENALERATILAGGAEIEPTHLPTEDLPNASSDAVTVSSDATYADAIEQATAAAARQYLMTVLRRFGGNVTRAAEHAGMERQSLHRLMKKYGVRSSGREGECPEETEPEEPR